MDEWIDGWMNEWINGWETSLPWTKLMKVRWIHGWMNEWPIESTIENEPN